MVQDSLLETKQNDFLYQPTSQMTSDDHHCYDIHFVDTDKSEFTSVNPFCTTFMQKGRETVPVSE